MHMQALWFCAAPGASCTLKSLSSFSAPAVHDFEIDTLAHPARNAAVGARCRWTLENSVGGGFSYRQPTAA